MNTKLRLRLVKLCVLVALSMGVLSPASAPLGFHFSGASGSPGVQAARAGPQEVVTLAASAPHLDLGAGIGGNIHLPLLMVQYPKVNARFGVEMHSITEGGSLGKVVQTGTQWVRRNGLHWMAVEKTEGVYSWDDPSIVALETELANAYTNGLEPILVVRTTPDWARLGKVAINPWGESFDFSPYICGPIAPAKYAAFGNFMYELVKRYSGHPYYVRYYQVGNEPEGEAAAVGDNGRYYGCWGWRERAYFNGESYGDMLSVIYPRVKQANPQAQVVFGGLVLDCNPALAGSQNCQSQAISFFEGALYRNGKRDGHKYFDVVAYHAYDFYLGRLGEYGHTGWNSYWNTQGPVISAKGNYIKDVLSQYGADDKTVMNTEGALMCGKSGTEPYCDEDFQLTKAYYLAEYFVVSSSLGLRTSIWYSIKGWRASGLLDQDGKPTPAYTSFSFLIKKLDNAVFSQQITEYPNVFVYEFKEGNQTIWFAWSKDGKPQTITLPSPPKKTWDALGAPQPVTGASVTITVKPLYIQW